MDRASQFAVMAALAALLAAGPFAQSRQESAQQDSSRQPAPKQNPAKPKSDKPGSDGKQTGNPPAPAPPRPTAEDNPFPEDVSRKAADDAAKEPSAPDASKNAPAATSPADSPDADSGVSSSRSNLTGDESSDVPERKVLPVPTAGRGTAKAKEDVTVGKFYLQSGDYQGAYDRYKEASALDPANADAIFGLAEAARHLHHAVEAERNYTLYLEIVPDGSSAKAARRELRSLQAAK